MKIGTHDGDFHCDEVLACYMLKCLPEFINAEIVRTEDPKILEKCDILVDVGGEHDHSRKRYDHNYREFNDTLSSICSEVKKKYWVKLSSAGLVYAYYGYKLIQHLSPTEDNNILTKDNLSIVFKKLYEMIILEIDAIDNDITLCKNQDYRVHTNLSSRIDRLNPKWNTNEDTNSDELFKDAMQIAGKEFVEILKYIINVWLPARDVVKLALENRLQCHSSCEIMELPQRMPWIDHLQDLEPTMGVNFKIQYVIFKDNPNCWIVCSLGKPMHPSCASMEGCIFCHYKQLSAANVTREGAFKMAEASLYYDVMHESLHKPKLKGRKRKLKEK